MSYRATPVTPLENRIKESETPSQLCPECGSDQVVEDEEQGEVVCRACGLIINHMVVSDEREWRGFAADPRNGRARAGPPASYAISDKRLSTTITLDARDGEGRTLSSFEQQRARKLEKWQRRMRHGTSESQNLYHASIELDRIADALRISNSIKEQAALIYRRALKERLVRGRSIVDVVAASVYAACRTSGAFRSLNEVARAANTKKKGLARVYRFLLRTLEIKMPPDDPARLIPKIANKVGVTTQVERRSLEILARVKAAGLAAGRSPKSIAAAVLYIACVREKVKISQSDIARAADVTEVTIRNRYREIVYTYKLFGEESFATRRFGLALNGEPGGLARVQNHEPNQPPLASTSSVQGQGVPEGKRDS